MNELQKKILDAISKSKTPLSYRVLLRTLKIPRKDTRIFNKALDELVKSKKIVSSQKGLRRAGLVNAKPATVLKIHDKFGFVRLEENEQEVFVPGHSLLGAMPGDKVLVTVKQGQGNLCDGVITEIVEHAPYNFSGTVIKEANSCKVLPDRDLKIPLHLRQADVSFVEDGEKVTVSIERYGKSHFDHIVKLMKAHGTAQLACNCCEAILEANSVSRIFPDDVIAQAEEISLKGIHPKEIAGREDLRDQPIFTIDSADSKDLDDAVSIKKLADGWELGVHIADVSYYVYQDSPLDKEAFVRGTSVYFADSVVPMLPPALSNGICSLNPNEDRLAFSAFVHLNKDCEIVTYSFRKTVIRSVVKGIYSEINAILEEKETPEIYNKYEKLFPIIFEMQDLADKLHKKRLERGAVNLESSESKIILDENAMAVDIKPRERGVSENIIEEFMLVANEAAASFAMDKGIPFVFRVHEPPSPEKLETLRELLSLLGINTNSLKAPVPCAALAEILKDASGTRYEKLLNNSVLRSMSKARYSENNLGHYGLVLKNYTHFTSPIRRYSDLVIHRIMSGLLTGMKRETIEKRYRQFAPQAASRASMTELRAMNIERDCENAYKAEYIKPHIGEEFDGIVSSAAPHGVYIELPNTVEGLCRREAIPGGKFVYDGKIRYKDMITGQTLSVGDQVRVKVLGANVAQGEIDFAIVSMEEHKNLPPQPEK